MTVLGKEHSKKHDRPQRGRKGQQNESVWRPARTGKGAQIHHLGNRGWYRLRKLPRWYRAGWMGVPCDLHGIGGGMMENPIEKVRELLNRPRSSTGRKIRCQQVVRLCGAGARAARESGNHALQRAAQGAGVFRRNGAAGEND